jgi:predicted phosphodiesterase
MFVVRNKMICSLFFVLMILIVFLASCDNDLFGLFYSPDGFERFDNRNNFKYLTDSDRQLLLGSNFSFIVLSDVHITGKDAGKLDRFAEIIKNNGDSFAVIIGDITQSGKKEELETFIHIAETFNVPCYPVIGNHDVYFGNWEKAWKKKIGSSTYKIDVGNTTLIMLDTANASFGEKQFNWLKKQLNTPDSHTFVFSHANLFTDSALDIQQVTDIRERARMMSILDGKCTALFSGHVHKRVTEEAGGVQYITLDDFKSNGTYCRIKVSSGNFSYEIKSL